MPAAVQGIGKTQRCLLHAGFEKVVIQRDDSERSHFVTSFSSLQLLLGCA